ncbi:hypothetical protein D3C81_805930 [compost metagenome]
MGQVGFERLQANRLEQAFIHATGQAARTLLGLRVGGDAENLARGQCAFAFEAADAPSQFVAVHDRHAAVGDHQVKPGRLPPRQRRFAVFSQGYAMPQCVQLPLQQQQIGRIVVDHQNVQRAAAALQHRGTLLCRCRCVACG